jgi:hypothetical protein
MRKVCTPSPSVRGKGNYFTGVKPSVDKAEKLDAVHSLLSKSAGHGVATPSQIVRDGALDPTSGPKNDGLTTSFSPINGHNGGTVSGWRPLPQASSPEAQQNAINSDSASPDVSPEEATPYLSSFREHFVQYLPFIVIPDSCIAADLHRESPILWMAIMTVASTRTTKQKVLSNKMREHFAQASFVDGTRSLDLLWGLLVYTAW